MKHSQRRRNHRSRKSVARFEKLEDRRVLAAVGMNVLTVDEGVVPPDGPQSIDLVIDPTEFQFSSPKQEVTLGEEKGDGGLNRELTPVPFCVARP